jgi:hypothetical protein
MPGNNPPPSPDSPRQRATPPRTVSQQKTTLPRRHASPPRGDVPAKDSPASRRRSREAVFNDDHDRDRDRRRIEQPVRRGERDARYDERRPALDDFRDSKRPRFAPSVPLTEGRRVMLISNLNFSMTAEEVDRELHRLLPDLKIVDIRCAPPNRNAPPGHVNSGVCIVYLDEKDVESCRALSNLGSVRIGNRVVSIVDNTSCELSVCVRGVPRDCNAAFVVSLFREGDIRGEPRRAHDSFVWFVDMRDGAAMNRALTGVYRDRICVTIASRRHGDDGRQRQIPTTSRAAVGGLISGNAARSAAPAPVARGGRLGYGNGARDREGFSRPTGGDARVQSRDYHDRSFVRDHDARSRENSGFELRTRDNDFNRVRHSPDRELAAEKYARQQSFGRTVDTDLRRSEISHAMDVATSFYEAKVVGNLDRSFVITNLPFNQGSSLAGHTDRVLKHVEHVHASLAVEDLKFLGRKCTSAIVVFRNPEACDLLQDRLMEGRKVDFVPFSHTAYIISAKGMAHDDVRSVASFCGAPDASWPNIARDPRLMCVKDNNVAVVRMLALDGYAADNQMINLRLLKHALSLTNPPLPTPAVEPASSRLPFNDARGRGRLDGDSWRIVLESESSTVGPNMVSTFLRSNGVYGVLSVVKLDKAEARKYPFEVTGKDIVDFSTVLRICKEGREITTGRRLEARVISSPLQDSRASRLRQEFSDQRRESAVGRFPPVSPRHGDASDHRSGEADARRRDSVLENGRDAPAWGRDRDLDPHLSRRRDFDRERRRNGDDGRIDARHDSSKPRPHLDDRYQQRPPSGSSRRTSGDIAHRKKVASTGASRGFRSSPSLRSPSAFVSAAPKSKRRVTDSSLPALRKRLMSLGGPNLTSVVPLARESFEDLCACIPSMRVKQQLVHTLKSDDAPYAPHVWHGMAWMGNNEQELMPVMCNGYLVVRRGQRDEDVRDALGLMPEVLAVKRRLPWGDPKHMHLIHANAVVFMVRSAREVDEDADGVGGSDGNKLEVSAIKRESVTQVEVASRAEGREVVSALDSQKNLLGMLKNLRDKQRIGLVRYQLPSAPERKLVALCIPPNPHAYEQLGVPWRCRDMAGHDTILVVVGEAKTSAELALGRE